MTQINNAANTEATIANEAVTTSVNYKKFALAAAGAAIIGGSIYAISRLFGGSASAEEITDVVETAVEAAEDVAETVAGLFR